AGVGVSGVRRGARVQARACVEQGEALFEGAVEVDAGGGEQQEQREALQGNVPPMANVAPPGVSTTPAVAWGSGLPNAQTRPAATTHAAPAPTSTKPAVCSVEPRWAAAVAASAVVAARRSSSAPRVWDSSTAPVTAAATPTAP